MIPRLILLLCLGNPIAFASAPEKTVPLFLVPGAASLRCKKASPSNCIYNSTCRYESSECQAPSSSHRGGMYCTTIIHKENEQILVGTMDCIYDQEASKKCSNHSQCLMKYTNDQKQFFHCCCDQHECNLNFSLSDPSPDSPTSIPSNPCKGLWCNGRSLLIIGLAFGVSMLVLVLLCLLYRNELILNVKKCSNPTEKSIRGSGNVVPETVPFLPNSDQHWQVNVDEMKIDRLIKRGRFTEIKHAFTPTREVALKVFENTEQSRALFTREKEIYSLPFTRHENILEYYGYCSNNHCSYLLFEYSPIGSLKDYLIGNWISSERDLLLILKQISEGLHYLHKDFRSESPSKRAPIAHRDFKSENLLVFAEHRIVICDLAMSTQIQQYQYGSNQQQQVGTPRYMSPELLAATIGSEETALLKCDVYALGIVLWEVLSRFGFSNVEEKAYRLPFEEQLLELNLNVNNPTVNEMDVISRLKEPRHRPLLDSRWNATGQLKSFEVLRTVLLDCWQFNPDLRVSSGVIFNRIHSSLCSL